MSTTHSRFVFNTVVPGTLLLIAILLFGGVCQSFILVHNGRDAQSWVTHTHLVLEKLNELMLGIRDAESGQRGYVLTENPAFLELYETGRTSALHQVDEIASLTADNPTQQARIAELRSLVRGRLHFLSETLDINNSQGFAAARAMVRTGRGFKLMAPLRAIVQAMTADEQQLLLKRMNRAQAASELLITSLSVISLCAIVVFLVLIGLIRRYIKDRQRFQQELENLSITDELTGILNRRGFLTTAPPLLKLAAREKIRCSLVFIDMDGLKKINDTRGHDEGSRAIKLVAASLTEVFRQADIVARYGGDEFVVLVYGVDPENSSELNQRIQSKLRELTARHNLPYELAASVGVEPFDLESEPEDALQAALAKADERMYAQKQERNHVTQTGKQMVKLPWDA